MSSAASAGRRVAIGVDFGTASGRVLLLDLATGEEVAVSEVRYPHGVIDARLPSNNAELPPDTALQDPDDYLEVLYRGIPEALEAGGVRAEDVVGIGIDFTACTVLPVTGDGTPLCRIDRFREHPFAWVKLWKHHSAQSIADRLNDGWPHSSCSTACGPMSSLAAGGSAGPSSTAQRWRSPLASA